MRKFSERNYHVRAELWVKYENAIASPDLANVALALQFHPSGGQQILIGDSIQTKELI